jgi:hypothetical protein
MDDLRRLISASRADKRQVCKDILQKDDPLELKMARCYYYLEKYNRAIKLFGTNADLSPKDQYLLGMCHYNRRHYTKALEIFLTLPTNEASNRIVSIYFDIQDVDGLLVYLTKIFNNFEINMLIPYDPLLILALIHDADLSVIQELLNRGAHPWVTSKYHDSALSKAIYNGDEARIQLFLDYMGYPITYEYYISYDFVIKKNDNIQYYLYKLFTDKKEELVEKYGIEFYENCYDNITEPDLRDDMSDRFCVFLKQNMGLLNKKLDGYGLQIVEYCEVKEPEC